MNLIQWCGIALILAILLLIVRRFRPEFAPILSASGGVLFFVCALGVLLPFLSYLKELAGQTGMETSLTLILKLFALCAVLQWACETCKELGESALADRLAFLGKAEMLCLCLPTLKELVALAMELLS